MLSLLDVSRYSVYSHKGKRIGKVNDLLFAPDGVRVVGLVVARPRLWFLFDLKDRYLALDRVEFRPEDKEVVVTAEKAAWDGAAAKRLGLAWDDTVIWVGMPVHTETTRLKLGAVRDGLFDPDTGDLSAIGLTGGVAADAAVGVRDLHGSLAKGFDGQAVVVADEAAAIETSGGAAAAAGKGAAVAGKAAGEAAAKAVLYGRAAAKVAGESEAGKKAMGWLRALKDEVVDAMGDPDDE